MFISKLESILFIANRPLSVKRLMEICDATKEEIEGALTAITEGYVSGNRGLRLVRSGNEVQMTSAPENAGLMQEFLRDETTGELTRPSLETLTIIAYRGPLTKPELEQVRGVNCSMILRNLLMRGLIEIEGDPQDLTAKYRVTIDFIRFLGVSSVEELPDYEKLRSHENVIRALEKANLDVTPEEAKEAAAATEPTLGVVEDTAADAAVEAEVDEAIAVVAKIEAEAETEQA
jgi:segregation and condensation protein B